MTLATPKRFTLEEYHRLTELGFFHEDDRVELIRGEIVQMAAKGTAHATCCRNLVRELSPLVMGLADPQCQDPITLPSGSEPEPDFALARLRPDHYRFGHPTPPDLLLVIEVADSSLEYDRNVKGQLYAEAKVSHFWIFNLLDHCLEAYSEPYQNSNGSYCCTAKRIFFPHQSIAVPNLADVLLDLATIFPG